MTEQKTLEAALTEVEEAASRTLAAAGAVTRTIKQARAAASTGKLPDMVKSIAQARQQLALLDDQVRELESSWSFDAEAYFGSGGYARELLAAIEARELRPVERDGRILCYPSILRIVPGEQALEIDRKKERRVRPGFVAAELSKRAGRRTGMRPEQMIEVLYNVWEPLAARPQATGLVRLVAIFDMLTLLPQAREYTKPEFARDLLQLDMSSVRTTRAGHRLKLRADTAAKGASVLSAVTPEGEVRIYSSIEFAG